MSVDVVQKPSLTAKPLENPENDCQVGEQDYKDNPEETVAKTEITKKRPNYFVALQITDKELIRKLEHMQTEILKKNPDFEEFEIPSCMFHLTLNVLKLNSEAEVVFRLCFGDERYEIQPFPAYESSA